MMVGPRPSLYKRNCQRPMQPLHQVHDLLLLLQKVFSTTMFKTQKPSQDLPPTMGKHHAPQRTA